MSSAATKPPRNRKPAAQFTSAQLEELERVYHRGQYPGKAVKQQLAETFSLSEQRIALWFHRRRTQERKMLKKEITPTTSALPSSSAGELSTSCSSSSEEERSESPDGVSSVGQYPWSHLSLDYIWYMYSPNGMMPQILQRDCRSPATDKKVVPSQNSGGAEC